jgi:hypothetical protein
MHRFVHFVHQTPSREAGNLQLHKMDSWLNDADILTRLRFPRLPMSSLTFAVVLWVIDPKRLRVSQDVKTGQCAPRFWATLL